MSAPSKITATCKRYILRIVITLCGLVLFHTTINKLFNKILKLLPIEFGKGYVDITLGMLTLLGAVFIPLKWLERYKNQLHVVWGFGVFLHLLDTFYWKEWSYTSMSVSMISYVVFFLYVFPFVFVVKGTVEKAHYLQKEEIKEEKLNDSFGYNTHAKKLLEFIKNRKGRDSYAIGINAKWGEGKSFFIDLFKEELVNSKSDKELIVVDFKPWFSHSPLDIINDFFTVFGERLEEEGIYIQSDLEKYKEALMGVETEEALLNQLLKSVKGLFDSDSKSSSLLYEHINNVLKEENRRFIVVIDDLDRLTKEELFEVIKLVRNSGSLMNTFFVLAYDRTYLEEALDSLQIGKYDKYLEKVIQLELKLPIVSEGYIGYANSYILREYKQYHKVWSEFVESTNGIEVFNANSSSVRSIEYLIDKVIYEISDIKEEVNFSDYFILHLLKEEKSFNIQDFLEIIKGNYDQEELHYKLVSKYNDESYIESLCICLIENIDSKHSLLGNESRLPTYLKAFVSELNYIPQNIYISLITNAQDDNYKKNIRYLTNNQNWKKDFVHRLKAIGEIDKQYLNPDVAKHIIKLFNYIMKNDQRWLKILTEIPDKGFVVLFTLMENLKGRFGLSDKDIKEQLFNIDYVCEFRAKILGWILKEHGGVTPLDSVKGILNKEDIIEINTKFLRLALVDKSLSAKEKMEVFLQLELPSQKRILRLRKQIIFHQEAKIMMFSYISEHIEGFKEIILEKDGEYKFHELFGGEPDFNDWVQENKLEDNTIISEYTSKYIKKENVSTSSLLSR